MKKSSYFDVVVVGGGHAGVEAASAAARLGAKTALITHRFDRIGEMSCNPAMGGLGKGHLMREVDALDGVIARASDKAGIQFRLLNRSRGPAVRGPRAQCDRDLFRSFMQAEMSSLQNLQIIESEVKSLIFESGSVCGVDAGEAGEIRSAAVVLTTGTFLRGVMHIGEAQEAGGRVGDASSVALADQLRSLDLRIGRLKTGTPARLVGSSIKYDRLEEQQGDEQPEPFSYLTDQIDQEQVSCWITATSEQTHEIIRSDIHRSAMHSGGITGVGPRYCPSIEDKVTRFADRTSHNVFLEPETRCGSLVYPNGISTSLPAEIQDKFIRSIKGLENVEIARFGYAIEYDFVDPTELTKALELKKAPGLYLAGQINGTTGYEEAAALGLMAGANAALAASGAEPFVLSRSEAYIGVLIDDLTTRGVTEPYRMFTSRAEYRLLLRADNADERLTGRGIDVGLVGQERTKAFEVAELELSKLRETLSQKSVTPHEAESIGIKINKDGVRRSFSDFLAYPDVSFGTLIELSPDLASVGQKLQARIEADALYAGYLDRQQREIDVMLAEEAFQLPSDLDYGALSSLSTEQKEKLSQIRPRDLAQARRIDGMTPGALAALTPFARRKDNKPQVSSS